MAKLEAKDIQKEEKYFISQIQLDKKIIFTEGFSDKKVIEDYYSYINCKKRTIIPADLIRNDNEKLKQKKYGDNNRDRIRYLYEMLLEEKDVEGKFLCIIDRDFDKLDDLDRTSTGLECTDYANIEMYFYDFDYLKRIIRLNYGELEDVEKTLNDMEKLLKELFFIRAYNREKNKERVDFKKNAKWNSKKQKFEWDRATYLSKFLKNNNVECRTASEYIDLKIKDTGEDDARYYIHGHDFEDIITNLLNNNGKDDKIINLLILQFDKEKYEKFRLFNKIREISQ